MRKPHKVKETITKRKPHKVKVTIINYDLISPL